MSFAKYNNKRIRDHLLKTTPEEFTAADIAKSLNLSTHTVAAHLRDIPEVKVKHYRKHARVESGILYYLVIP